MDRQIEMNRHTTTQQQKTPPTQQKMAEIQPTKQKAKKPLKPTHAPSIWIDFNTRSRTSRVLFYKNIKCYNYFWTYKDQMSAITVAIHTGFLF